MDRARVRALVIVVSGLSAVLPSAPVNTSLTAPNKPEKSTTDPGYLEQSFFEEQVKFLYVCVPDEFVAEGMRHMSGQDLTKDERLSPTSWASR
jgi:hypothetical protein